MMHTGKDAFHRVPQRLRKEWDAVERVLTKWMKAAMVLTVSFVSVSVSAENSPSAFEAANRLYLEGKFSEAATTYGILEQSGQKSAALYFNWGNALFKSQQLGRAIAAYRHAEELAPRDPDIRA